MPGSRTIRPLRRAAGHPALVGVCGMIPMKPEAN